jgi:hypothetical protein
MGAEGLGKKTRILDDRKTGPQEVTYLRQYAATLINDALERAGVDERVDARSFEARGIDREATEHLGPTASEMEREGQASERGDRNREIEEANREMDELVEELVALDAEIAAEEQRLLDERYGHPEEIEQDTLDPEPPPSATDGGDPHDRILSEEEKREARSAFERVVRRRPGNKSMAIQDDRQGAHPRR